MAETAVSRMTDDEITPDLRTEALSNPRLHVIDHPMVQHKLPDDSATDASYP